MHAPAPPDDESWSLDDIPEDIDRFLRKLAATPNASGWRSIQTYVRSQVRRFPDLREVADDLVQEVLATLSDPSTLASFRNRHQQDPAGVSPRISFLSFLHTTTVRRCLTERERQARLSAKACSFEEMAAREQVTVLPDGGGDLADDVAARLLLEQVDQQLQRIRGRGPRGRLKVACFLLVAVQGLPQKEVAQRYHLKVSQVRDAVRAVRQQLRALLSPEEAAAKPPTLPSPPPLPFVSPVPRASEQVHTPSTRCDSHTVLHTPVAAAGQRHGRKPMQRKEACHEDDAR